MANGGNEELERVLRVHRRRAKRFAVLQWTVYTEFYDTEDEARAAMAQVSVERRAGIVDRETGETRTSKAFYRPVMDALRKAGTAPEHFRRIGALGSLKKKRTQGRPGK